MAMTKPLSEQVRFTQDGTGAVERLASEKLKEWVSVKDFGAVGDGVADDTAAIQSAVDAAVVVCGVPGEEYKVTSISIPSGRTLEDMRLKSAGGAVDMVSVINIDGTVQPKSDIVLRRIKIDGNRQAHTSIVTPAEDGGRHGIRVVGKVSDLQIIDCEANYCATEGLLIFSAGATFPAFENIQVINCKFSNNRRHGASFDSAIGVKFQNVTANANGLDLNGVGPLDSGTRGARFAGSLYGNGCDVESYGAGTHVQDVSFIDCVMLDNARAGLLFLPSSVGYGQPGWEPFSNLVVSGGKYNHGVDSSSEGYSLQFVGLGLTAGQIGLRNVFVDASHLVTGLLVKHVQEASISISSDFVNPVTNYHAAVIDSFNVGLDVKCPQVTAIYEANCTVAKTNKFYSTADPILSVASGPVRINSQSATLVASSKELGQLYRLDANVQLTGTASNALALFSINSSGRRVVECRATGINNTDGSSLALHYKDLGYTLSFRPLGLSSFTLTIFVSVL